MVKPGVYTINKEELKNGDNTTEYVHVEVQPLPPKYDTVVKERKGCTGMRLLGVFLFLLVIVGIAVGITYAVRWEEGGSPDKNHEDHEGRPHHGDGDNTDDSSEDHDDRPHHGDDDDTDDTSEDHDGRPHHGDDDDTDDSSEDHDGRPHHGDGDNTDDSSEDHDGRPHHGNDDGEDDDDDKINHRNMNNPPFRSINQWKSERAGREKMVAQRRPIQARPAYQGRSRVETEEARYGHDYGHSGKQYRKRA
ncbi:uncharacterized protein [Apostichopus japonicus]|uniref:uncharacterized protein n=1 Tax=Stichopus japonicus TaxID=307972 RepID=UPI003AB7F293